jgi:hypothetical protein
MCSERPRPDRALGEAASNITCSCDEIRAGYAAFYVEGLACCRAFSPVVPAHRHPIVLAIARAIIERIFGPEAAERFSVFWLDAMMWTAELALLLAPVVLAIYVAFRLARWLIRKKEP